jgi:Ser/Thr protein kinase RdoA (MazF antagonist)
MLTPAALQILCEPFGLAAERASFVARSQNDVYAFGDLVLRISHGRGQTQSSVENELSWIEDLAARGLPVCRAHPSRSGRLCERVVLDGIEYLVTQFERAPGHKVTAADVTDDLYAVLGELTARLHAASFDIDPPAHTRFARPWWYESRLLIEDVARYTPPSDERFRATVHALVNDLKIDAGDPPCLVHGDISFSNVFLDDGKLTLFDFDNCEVGTVVQDLATVFYDAIYCHLLNRIPSVELASTYRRRCRVFLAAYRSVRPLRTLPTERLQRFLILREAIIYTHYCRILDRATLRPSFKEGMDQMRSNVERGITDAEFEDA